MENNKLITATQFILHESENYLNGFISLTEYHRRTKAFADFLSQPLKLEMFVPVSSKGDILKGKPLSPAEDSEWIRWENEQEEFFAAREKVLFEGFELLHEAEGYYKLGSQQTVLFFDSKAGEIYTNSTRRRTIEQLCYLLQEPITLSQTALKQIYG